VGPRLPPEYRELDVLHARWPHVPRIALTATADAPTRREIVERLALRDAREFVSSFDRPNIRYRVVAKHDSRRQLAAFLAAHRGASGIVYCLSRRKVDETAASLREAGVDALPYHAGMDAQVRAANQRRFLREDGVVMVATIAFGMGIDKPDVRFVAHLDLPKSIEGYYQETGRAGRDGEPADAWLCYGLGDVVAMRQMIDGNEAGEERKRVERRKLDALFGYCEATRCRRQLLLDVFGEAHPGACGNCDNCLEPPETWDATEEARKALSAAYRTGQRFGAAYLIDVLRGTDEPRIAQFGHDRLTVYGIGREHDANRWRSILRQLVALGLLDVDVDGYGALRLSERSRAVLTGGERVRLRVDAAVPRAKRRKGDGAAAPAAPATLAGDTAAQARFERLRAWRATTAREQNVPAYVIFHDATLAQLAAARPRSLESLATVPGVGTRKLERYGEALLTLLADDA
jgi:ATP-dependent DNA helicase RecQ